MNMCPASVARIGRILLACALFSLGGCALSPYYGAVNFISDPPGAEIINLYNDTNLGTTPVRVSFPGAKGSSEVIHIRVKKEGYQGKDITVGVNKTFPDKESAEAAAVDQVIHLQPKTGAESAPILPAGGTQ